MGMTKRDPLKVKIEDLREKMTRVAIQNGFSSPESVRISQELDELLNRELLNRYQMKKK